MSESTHYTPGQFDGQDPYAQQIPHSGNLPEDMREVPADPQHGPLQEHLVHVPGSSADIPTPVGDTSESFLQRHKRALLATGAAVLAFIAGGVTLYEVGNGGGKVAAQSAPTTPGRPSNAPGKTEAPTSGSASVSTSPSKVSLPGKTASASKSEAPSGGLTLEQLNSMTPLVANYDPKNPTGSEETIKTLYKDLQYADQSGRVDFLIAAIGQDNMGTNLGTEYIGDINQFQQWFQQHPDQRLSFSYVPSEMKQDMSVTTPTWNLIVTQTTGDTVQKYAQTITLKTQQDANGNVTWYITSIDAAVPVS